MKAKVKTKTIKPTASKCGCGRIVNGVISPYITPYRVACQCGNIHHIDERPPDWKKIARGGVEHGAL